jgi:membrane-bound lytic murein transglycosylase MltF
VAVRTGASLAVAIRKQSPRLKAELDAFLSKFGLGTAFGNIMAKRYLESTAFVKQAASEAERKKFMELAALFRKYGEQYRMDYLLMAAQGYQESRLEQNTKSAVGAVGVMQVMPATGKELKVGDIRQVGPNVHAGVKYMRFMIDQYFKDEPMDDLNKGLFAFASYNGPNRSSPAQGGGKAGSRPERVVRQRADRCLREDRPRDSDVRREHLQVLHRVQARGGAGRRAAPGARGREGAEVVSGRRRGRRRTVSLTRRG